MMIHNDNIFGKIGTNGTKVCLSTLISFGTNPILFPSLSFISFSFLPEGEEREEVKSKFCSEKGHF